MLWWRTDKQQPGDSGDSETALPASRCTPVWKPHSCLFLLLFEICNKIKKIWKEVPWQYISFCFSLEISLAPMTLTKEEEKKVNKDAKSKECSKNPEKLIVSTRNGKEDKLQLQTNHQKRLMQWITEDLKPETTQVTATEIIQSVKAKLYCIIMENWGCVWQWSGEKTVYRMVQWQNKNNKYNQTTGKSKTPGSTCSARKDTAGF